MNISYFSFVRAAFAGLAILFLAISPARSELTISVEETGGDVVFTFSGDIDTTGKVAFGNFGAATTLYPMEGDIEVTAASTDVDRIDLQATVAFGSGSSMEDVGVASGDTIAIYDSRLFLSQSYVSGSPINTTLTFAGATFASLGVDNNGGPYVWTTVTSGDTITMSFPEPPVLPPANQNAFANASEKSALFRGIKGLQKKAKKLKKKGKKAKAKKLQKKIKKLKKQLKALG